MSARFYSEISAQTVVNWNARSINGVTCPYEGAECILLKYASGNDVCAIMPAEQMNDPGLIIEETPLSIFGQKRNTQKTKK